MFPLPSWKILFYYTAEYNNPIAKSLLALLLSLLHFGIHKYREKWQKGGSTKSAFDGNVSSFQTLLIFLLKNVRWRLV